MTPATRQMVRSIVTWMPDCPTGDTQPDPRVSAAVIVVSGKDKSLRLAQAPSTLGMTLGVWVTVGLSVFAVCAFTASRPLAPKIKKMDSKYTNHRIIGVRIFIFDAIPYSRPFSCTLLLSHNLAEIQANLAGDYPQVVEAIKALLERGKSK